MRTGTTGSATQTEEKRSDRKKPMSDGRKQVEGAWNTRTDQALTGRPSPWGQPGRWATKEAALKGVPLQEHEEYFRTPESCWCCGQKGHRIYECFTHTTQHESSLPKAPWKAAGVTTMGEGKGKRSEELEENPAPKQQKIATVMEEGPSRALPIWADDSDQSDF